MLRGERIAPLTDAQRARLADESDYQLDADPRFAKAGYAAAAVAALLDGYEVRFESDDHFCVFSQDGSTAVQDLRTERVVNVEDTQALLEMRSDEANDGPLQAFLVRQVERTMRRLALSAEPISSFERLKQIEVLIEEAANLLEMAELGVDQIPSMRPDAEQKRRPITAWSAKKDPHLPREDEADASLYLNTLKDPKLALRAIFTFEGEMSPWLLVAGPGADPDDLRRQYAFRESVHAAFRMLVEERRALLKRGYTPEDVKRQASAGFEGPGGFNRYHLRGDGMLVMSAMHGTGSPALASRLGIAISSGGLIIN